MKTIKLVKNGTSRPYVICRECGERLFKISVGANNKYQDCPKRTGGKCVRPTQKDQ